jgi:hypothetical protein
MILSPGDGSPGGGALDAGLGNGSRSSPDSSAQRSMSSHAQGALEIRRCLNHEPWRAWRSDKTPTPAVVARRGQATVHLARHANLRVRQASCHDRQHHGGRSCGVRCLAGGSNDPKNASNPRRASIEDSADRRGRYSSHSSEAQRSTLPREDVRTIGHRSQRNPRVRAPRQCIHDA